MTLNGIDEAENGSETRIVPDASSPTSNPMRTSEGSPKEKVIAPSPERSGRVESKWESPAAGSGGSANPRGPPILGKKELRRSGRKCCCSQRQRDRRRSASRTDAAPARTNLRGPAECRCAPNLNARRQMLRSHYLNYIAGTPNFLVSVPTP
jgi:hypothetical protein